MPRKSVPGLSRCATCARCDSERERRSFDETGEVEALDPSSFVAISAYHSISDTRPWSSAQSCGSGTPWSSRTATAGTVAMLGFQHRRVGSSRMRDKFIGRGSRRSCSEKFTVLDLVV